MAATRTATRDLFGKPIRRRRPRFEWSLQRVESATLPARAERVRWLERVAPRNNGYAMPLETHVVFQEAKSAFVYGCFVSSTVLAAAFVEHWLGVRLSDKGYSKDVARGISSMVTCCRKHSLLNPELIKRIDRLRQIRNPFVHLKSFDHPHNLSQRTFAVQSHPAEVLERDAKESLITMYTLAVYAT